MTPEDEAREQPSAFSRFEGNPSRDFAPPATDPASRAARNERVRRFLAHSPHFGNVGDLAHWLDLLPEEASEALSDLGLS